MVLLLRVIGLDELSDGRRKLRVEVGVGQFLLVGRRCLRRRAREERLEKATDRLELLEGYLAPSLPLPRAHHGEVPQASGSARAKRKTDIRPWTTSGTTHLAHIGVGRIVPLLRSCEWRRTSTPGERQEEADGKCTRCSPKSLHNQPHRRAHDRPCNTPKDMRTAMFVLSPLAPLLMQNASAIFSKSAAV